MLLPTLNDCSSDRTFITGYVGQPSWDDDSIRVSFIASSVGALSVFVHAFGTTHNVAVVGSSN